MNLIVYLWMVAVLHLGSDGQAGTITVGLDPACDFDTIQGAIDAAESGDIITVADGTYTGLGNRDVDFRSKAVTVRSANGPGSCHIDCLDLGRGFIFQSGETKASVLDGFTITHGTADLGGGICFLETSSPTVANCVFLENDATHGGGAIYVSDSSPTLTACVFTRNQAGGQSSIEGDVNLDSPTDGGAVFIDGGSIMLTACRFRENVATGGGGAIAMVDSLEPRGEHVLTGVGAVLDAADQTTVLGCVFWDNYSASDGGALNIQRTSVELTSSFFLGNTADRDGGAIYCQEETFGCMRTCTFINNSAGDHGGAICNRDNCSYEMLNAVFAENHAGSMGGATCHAGYCRLTYFNCLVFGNTAQMSGGALCSQDSSETLLLNCTISDNTAVLNVGGILNADDCNLGLTNCIVWGNNDGSGAAGDTQICGAALTVVSSCIQDAEKHTVAGDGLDQDPLFVRGPFGDYYLAQTAAGQNQDSPCCDAGTTVPGDIDLAAFTTRTDHGRDADPVDIGYHYPSVRIWLSPRIGDFEADSFCRQTGG